MKTHLLFTAAVACVLVAGVAGAQDVSERKGYWFYIDPPPPVEDSEEPAFKDLPPPPSEEVLLAMHPQEVEKMIEDYREYALWKMEPEHVKWYYELQDFARRRSRAFMNVTDMVMLENADLNMKSEYPTNVPGINARAVQRDASLSNRLTQERERSALLLLTRKSCGYCEAQRSTLRYFAQKHGWQVREIDIDEVPQASVRFATSYTPTTIVIFRGSQEWMPVAVGVDSVPGLEESVYRAVRMLRGETTPEQFSLREYQAGGLLDPIRGEQ